MLVTRFAPSPTGYLHLGHAFSAVTGWRVAEAEGGLFRLRIDDIDQARCRPEYEAAIEEDLRWLGLDWPRPTRRQSDHLAEYGAAVDRLREMGVLYPCFCTRRGIRAEIARMGKAPHGPEGPLYPGTCRAVPQSEREARIEAGGAYALRLDVAAAAARVGPLGWRDRLAGRQPADPAITGDVVLTRKDAPASYHLAVVVDDAAEAVTLVTRGADLAHTVPVQRLLQALLGLPEPEYLHHGLVTDEEGRRLAKRDDARAIRSYREQGLGPGEVLAMIGVVF